MSSENEVYTKKIKHLHDLALKLENTHGEKEVCDKIIETAEELLNFNFCNIALVEDEMLVPRAASSDVQDEKKPITEGIAGKTYRERRSFLVNNIENNHEAVPVRDDFKSGLSIPVGEFGVFQAISDEQAAFSREDLELAELLCSHASAALNRINSRKKLENKNSLLNSILESIQEGISVLDKDLTIRYTNIKMKEWYSENTPLEGKKCFEAFHNAEDPCESCPSLRSLDSGEVENEIVPGLSDSEVNYLEVFSYPISSGVNGEVSGIVEFARDITDRRRIEEKLKFTQFSVNKAPVGVFWITPEGVFEYVNDRACEMLNYSREELVGKRVADIDPNFSAEEHHEEWERIKGKKYDKMETELITQNGEKFPAEVTSRYLEYKNKEYEFAFVQDISERKQAEKDLRYKTFHDDLTELYNRRFFVEELKRLDTARQLPLSIIIADINGLKIVNDSLGHKKGDELIVKAANILRRVTREEDILARYGVDEFAILLPQTDNNKARKISQRIKSHCENFSQDKFPVFLGIGLATKNRTEQNIEAVLKEADNKMYRDKLEYSRSKKAKVVKSLQDILAGKSGEDERHIMRMKKLARELGEKIGLKETDLEKLEMLAEFHDIGKSAIAKGILSKPDYLNEEEWAEIEKHPERGFKIISASEEFAVIAEEVLAHHERWDGWGYPRGLQGEEIPLLARIITLVDAYEVMTSDRPYSEAISHEKALEEIKNCAGSQFDPELTEEFLALMA